MMIQIKDPNGVMLKYYEQLRMIEYEDGFKLLEILKKYRILYKRKMDDK